jgi:F-type H+-transporting ATPase subunit gamma
MFRQVVASPVVSTLTKRVALAATPVRHAGDKALKQRMVAVGNIKKITKAMKMVASAKVRRAQDNLMAARDFSKGILDMFPEVKPESTDVTTLAPKSEGEGRNGGYLVLAVTPDRGLCGSVNGSIVRGTRARGLHHGKVGRPVTIIGMGEKTRAGLERLFAKDIRATIGEHSKLRRRTFKQSALLADYILKNVAFDQGEIVYNWFRNMIGFETRVMGIQSLPVILSEPKTFEAYDIEGDQDSMENFYQFAFAMRLHLILSETDMVEFSQRVNSMTNSSKNAEDMLVRLRLLYNRVRQARVTTELVEIISGATAADDAAKAQ